VCPRSNANAAIALGVAVFGPTERSGCLRTLDGPVLHAELTIGDPLIIVVVGVPNFAVRSRLTRRTPRR